MGVVGHEPRVVAVCQRREPMQGSDIPVHGENAVGRDQGTLMTPAQLRQQRPDMPHIRVAERDDGGAREPRPSPEAGMGQVVDEDEITPADKRRNDAEIGEVAGPEDARCLRAFQPREPQLKLTQ